MGCLLWAFGIKNKHVVIGPECTVHGIHFTNNLWAPDPNIAEIQYGVIIMQSNFLQNYHKRHPIARPLGRAMGCLLCIQTLIYIPYPSLKWYMQHRVILECVIMTNSTVCYCREKHLSYHLFCTKHESWSIVTCAKVCSDKIARIKTKALRIFTTD